MYSVSRMVIFGDSLSDPALQDISTDLKKRLQYYFNYSHKLFQGGFSGNPQDSFKTLADAFARSEFLQNRAFVSVSKEIESAPAPSTDPVVDVVDTGDLLDLDYAYTDHDSSVYGPAAYFYDLMRIMLSCIKVGEPDRYDHIKYTLVSRRPDLLDIPLDDADTTDVLVPTLSIVNYVLARQLTQKLLLDTDTQTGKPPTYRELMRRYDVAAFDIIANTSGNIFNLPFVLDYERQERYLKAMGKSLYDINRDVAVLIGKQNDPQTQTQLAIDYLGINSAILDQLATTPTLSTESSVVINAPIGGTFDILFDNDRNMYVFTKFGSVWSSDDRGNKMLLQVYSYQSSYQAHPIENTFGGSEDNCHASLAWQFLLDPKTKDLYGILRGGTTTLEIEVYHFIYKSANDSIGYTAPSQPVIIKDLLPPGNPDDYQFALDPDTKNLYMMYQDTDKTADPGKQNVVFVKVLTYNNARNNSYTLGDPMRTRLTCDPRRHLSDDWQFVLDPSSKALYGMFIGAGKVNIQAVEHGSNYYNYKYEASLNLSPNETIADWQFALMPQSDNIPQLVAVQKCGANGKVEVKTLEPFFDLNPSYDDKQFCKQTHLSYQRLGELLRLNQSKSVALQYITDATKYYVNGGSSAVLAFKLDPQAKQETLSNLTSERFIRIGIFNYLSQQLKWDCDELELVLVLLNITAPSITRDDLAKLSAIKQLQDTFKLSIPVIVNLLARPGYPIFLAVMENIRPITGQSNLWQLHFKLLPFYFTILTTQPLPTSVSLNRFLSDKCKLMPGYDDVNKNLTTGPDNDNLKYFAYYANQTLSYLARLTGVSLKELRVLVHVVNDFNLEDGDQLIKFFYVMGQLKKIYGRNLVGLCQLFNYAYPRSNGLVDINAYLSAAIYTGNTDEHGKDSIDDSSVTFFDLFWRDDEKCPLDSVRVLRMLSKLNTLNQTIIANQWDLNDLMFACFGPGATVSDKQSKQATSIQKDGLTKPFFRDLQQKPAAAGSQVFSLQDPNFAALLASNVAPLFGMDISVFSRIMSNFNDGGFAFYDSLIFGDSKASSAAIVFLQKLATLVSLFNLKNSATYENLRQRMDTVLIQLQAMSDKSNSLALSAAEVLSNPTFMEMQHWNQAVGLLKDRKPTDPILDEINAINSLAVAQIDDFAIFLNFLLIAGNAQCFDINVPLEVNADLIDTLIQYQKAQTALNDMDNELLLAVCTATDTNSDRRDTLIAGALDITLQCWQHLMTTLLRLSTQTQATPLKQCLTFFYKLPKIKEWLGFFGQDERLLSAYLQQKDPAFIANHLAQVLQDKDSDAYDKAERDLDQCKRDVLVNAVLQQFKFDKDLNIDNADKLSEYLLIDVQMTGADSDTPIVQAHSTLQWYLRRCVEGVEEDSYKGLSLDATKINSAWWSWLQNYRVWEANRKIFLYPENFLAPELRIKQSDQFAQLARSFHKAYLDDDTIEQAYLQYLTEVMKLEQMEVCAVSEQPQSGNLQTLIIVGRTKSQPAQYYQRKVDVDASGDTPKYQNWGFWKKIDVSIDADKIVATWAYNRLYLHWLQKQEVKTKDAGNVSISMLSGKKLSEATVANVETEPTMTTRYKLFCSYQHLDGSWQPAQLIDKDFDEDKAAFNPFKFSCTYKPSSSDSPSWVTDALKPSEYLLVSDTVPPNFFPRINRPQLFFDKSGQLQIDPPRFFYPPSKAKTSLSVPDSVPEGPENWQFLLDPKTKDLYGISYAESSIKLYVLSAKSQYKERSLDGVTLGTEPLPSYQGLKNWQFLLDPDTKDLHVIEYLSDNPKASEIAYNGLVLRSVRAKGGYKERFNDVPLGKKSLPLYEGPIPPYEGPKSWQFLLDPKTKDLHAIQYAVGGLYLRSVRAKGGYKERFNDVELRTNLLGSYEALKSLQFLLDPKTKDLLATQYHDDGNLKLWSVGAKDGAVSNEVLLPPDSYYSSPISKYEKLSTQQCFFDDESKNVLLLRMIRTSTETTYTVEVNAIPMVTVVPEDPRLSDCIFYSSGHQPQLLHLNDACLIDSKDVSLFLSTLYKTLLSVSSLEEVFGKVAQLNLSYDDPWGQYYWELMYFAPMVLANALQTAGQYDKALAWYKGVFNPSLRSQAKSTTDATKKSPFVFPPFMAVTGNDILNPLLNNDDLNDFHQHLAEPHRMAALRGSLPYKKYTVMQYVKNLLAWGDSLFTDDTRESIAEALSRYLAASDLLGDSPRQLYSATYLSDDQVDNQHQTFDDLFQKQVKTYTTSVDEKPLVIYPYNYSAQSYFHVPENREFMALWSQIADRLYKIRHCLNIDGVRQELALLSPEIDPHQLVSAIAARGGEFVRDMLNQLTGSSHPHYRFAVLVERAKEFSGYVQRLGDALLSVLERQDSAALVKLNNDYSEQMLDAMISIRQSAIDQATNDNALLTQRQTSIQRRIDYYTKLLENNGRIFGEVEAELLFAEAAAINSVIGGMMTAGQLAGGTVPQFTEGDVGIAGPAFWVTDGGEEVKDTVNAEVGIMSALAGMEQWGAELALRESSYIRRNDQWRLELDLANKELDELKTQQKAGDIRLQVAEAESANHQLSIAHQREVSRYYNTQFTNIDLYCWMVDQLYNLYSDAYQLALRSANQAAQAYQYELGVQSSFSSSGFWSTSRKGLLAGQKLTHQLHRMQQDYLDNDARCQEIETVISLREVLTQNNSSTWSSVIGTLKTDGLRFQLNDKLKTQFSEDKLPGKRTIKMVSVSIPALAAPNQQVNLILERAGTTDKVSISKGVAATGMFAPSFQDARYLPFEGLALDDSQWTLSLGSDTADPSIYDSITDIQLRVYYTIQPTSRAALSLTM